MGVNLFYFYKMTGRVQIDLMKVAQRDFKLSSYKLDYVASNFIRDNIIDIKKLENTAHKCPVSLSLHPDVEQVIDIQWL